MSKCQAKVEKTVPSSIWGVTKKLENCPNDAKGEGIFCEVHGCFDCSLKSVKVCSEYEGAKLCLSCRGSRVIKKHADEERKNKIAKEGYKAFRREEKERLRKEAEEKERLRKEAEEKERLRKEAEEKERLQRERERERERDKLKGLPD